MADTNQAFALEQFDDFFADFTPITAKDTAAPTGPIIAKAPEPKAEEVKTEKVEVPVVEQSTEDIEEKQETVEEPVSETEEQTEETPAVVVEEKPKRKRRTKAQIEADRLKEAEAKAAAEAAKAEETEEPTSESEEKTEEIVEAPVAEAPKDKKKKEVPNNITITITPDKTYKDMINALDLLPAVDDDFVKTKEEIQTKMNQIVVQAGMDRPNIEIMEQKIDELNALISARKAAMKTAYENLSSKDDGILMRQMAKGSMAGSPFGAGNDAARRANGIHAAENFISPRTKETINLFYCVYATRYAKNFYEAACEQLENKRRLLKQQADFITMHV